MDPRGRGSARVACRPGPATLPVTLSCRWPTAGGVPFFANLKVMRLALQGVRAAVEERGGCLGAYLFFDDVFRFLARGTPGPGEGEARLTTAVERGRDRAAAAFRSSDGKQMWGEPVQVILPPSEVDAAVDALMQAPVAAGLAPEPGDYPWCGGPWLLARL